MKICPRCGKEIDDVAMACVNCGQIISASDRKAQPVEIILAVLFPIVGCILYYVYKKDKPTAAKTLNTVSLCAFLAYFVFGCLIGMLPFIFSNMLV